LLRRRHRRHGTGGQAVVEFALALPLLLLVSLGIVDFARAFNAQIALRDGIREAAIYAGQGTNFVKWCAPAGGDALPCPAGATVANESPDPDNIAFQLEGSSLELQDLTLATPVCSANPCVRGSTVTISATYELPLLTPVIGDLLGGSVEMTASTTSTVLQ
jgi:hypothetical protein